MIFKQLNRLQQLDQLIRLQRTGNAEALAQKFNVSRKHVYNCIDELRAFGMEIEYDRNIKSFVYKKDYKVDIVFNIYEITQNKAIKINTGTNLG